MAPSPVFLPGEFHRQKSPVGYSPWGHRRVGQDLATKEKQQILYLNNPIKISSERL